MVKMTGATYKAFMSADWDALLGADECFIEDEEVTVDGSPFDTDSLASRIIPDAAVVTLNGGAIISGSEDRNREKNWSTTATFKKWLKTQTHTSVLVSMPVDNVGAFRTLIDAYPKLGAKIIL